MADCTETIEATVRKRRLLFARFVMSTGDVRRPKRVMLGRLEGEEGYRGGQEDDWMQYLEDDFNSFDMEEEKEERKGKTSAKVEKGVHAHVVSTQLHRDRTVHQRSR